MKKLGKLSIFLVSLGMVLGSAVGIGKDAFNVVAEGGTEKTFRITQTTKSAASISGDSPAGITVEYTNTYEANITQLTKNNLMTYTIHGMSGLTITSLKMSMHSNKSAGTGKYSFISGSTTLSEIESNTGFNQSAWNGAWTQEFVDIVKPIATDKQTPVSSGDDVVLTISASANSLFCQYIEITYKGGSTPTTDLTVTYDVNGGSGIAPTDSNTYQSGDTVTVLDKTNTMNKTGYAFGGWCTESECTSNPYIAGSVFNITDNTTLYAKWNKIVVTSITSIASKPTSVEQYSTISTEDVLLNVVLSNGETDQRHPDTITVDTETTGTKTVTVNIDDASTTFAVTVTPFEGSTYDFRFIPDGSIDNTGWGNSYAEHVVEYDDATVTFTEASKQNGTIINQPVTKGSDVTFVAKDHREITEISWTFTQWGSKAQTVTLHYSTDGGVTYSATTITTDNFYIPMSELPEDTNAVKLSFSSSSNQIGIASCRARYFTPKVLTSISLNTENVQKEFTVGDTFNYDNLVVTANYNDGDSHVVTPTNVSIPDMTTKGEKTVTVTYTDECGTASEIYTINVKDAAAEKRTVTFYSNGVVVGTLEVEDGFKIQKPTDPINKGYEFGGWFTDNSTFLIEWDFENDVVDGYDVDLYAKWTLITYTLIYDINGGKGGEVPGPSEYTVLTSLQVTVAAIPSITKNQYICSGWNSTSKSDGIHFDPNETFDISESLLLDENYTVTLYAEWTASSVTGIELSLKDPERTFVEGNFIAYEDLKIQRVYENGYKDSAPKGDTTITVKIPGSDEFTDASETPLKFGENSIKAEYGSFEPKIIKIDVGKSTKKVYTLADSISLGDKIIFVSRNDDKYYGMADQKANNRNGIEVVFNEDGDIIVEGETNVNLRELCVEDGAVDESFVGTFAFKDEIQGGYLYTAGGATNNYLRTEDNKDDKGHASFGATFNDDDDKTWSLLAAVTDESRNKLCFNFNSADFVTKFPLFSCYASTATQYKDISFYRLVEDYTITYDGNGATSGAVPVDDNVYHTGDTTAVLDEGNLKKDEYTFNCWNTLADGSGTSYEPGDPITFGNTDIVLYATWIKLGLKTITFNAGGASGNVPDDIVVELGEIVTIPSASSLSKMGYKFNGWSSTDGNIYNPGDSFALMESMTLTATWTFAGQEALYGVETKMNLGYTYNKTAAVIHDFENYTGNGNDLKAGEKIIIKSILKEDDQDVVYYMNHNFEGVKESTVLETGNLSNYEYTVVLIDGGGFGLFNGSKYLNITAKGTTISDSNTPVALTITSKDNNYMIGLGTRGIFSNTSHQFKNYAYSNLGGSDYAKETILMRKEIDIPESYSNDTFRMQAGVEGLEEFVEAFNYDKTDDRKITQYGIKVMRDGKEDIVVYFNNVDDDHYVKELGDLRYIILNYGNALTATNDKGEAMYRMLDKVTVCAFVIYDGVTYVSYDPTIETDQSGVLTRNIAQLVVMYHDLKYSAVEDLYLILVNNGIIIPVNAD